MLPGGRNSEAYAINSRGAVAGISDAGGTRRLGFRWRNGRMQALLPLPGGVNSAAYGINDRAHVAGVSDIVDPKTRRLQTRAVMWKADRPLDLRASADDEDSVAYAINSHDDVVGRVSKDDENQAFLYSKNSITRLGIQGSAFSINDSGEIVGVIDPPERGRSSGFLWQHGKAFDLNDLLMEAKGFRIEAALAIDENGEILCIARFRLGTHILLLHPQGLLP